MKLHFMKLHKHHIVPKHAGGTDDKNNLIVLTVEEHALAHKKLFEQYGRKQDYIAWLALSRQITSDEARRLAVSLSLKGKTKTEEQKRKMSIARKKRGGITTGMSLGPASEERKRKISQANKGNKHRLGKKTSETTKFKMSLATQTRSLVQCPKCKTEMQKASIARYHGLNGEKCKTNYSHL